MSVGAIRAGRAMVEIFADSSMLSRGLASAQGKMAKFASTLRRLGTAQVVVGGAFAAPLAAAVVQYAKLEQRINTVRALTGATVGQMRVLSDQIRQIGMATGTSFSDIADAMAELSRAGVRLRDLGPATRVVSDFARAAGVEMGRAANIGVEIVTQFGLSMEHLPRVADVLQEMANATVSTVEELSDGFRYAGQTANMFGLSLEQTAAAIAYLQQSGLSASTAGTSFNQMLLQIVQNLDKLEGAIGGLRGADGEFLPFAEILAKLQRHIRGLPGPDRLRFLNEMFDVRGMRGAEALLKNIEAWQRLTVQAQGSTGATARKAAEMAKAFVVSFERMRNGVVALAYAIGEALDAPLRAAFEAIGNISITVSEFVKQNQGLVRSFAGTAAALVASGAAFFTVGIALQLAAFSMEGFIKVFTLALSPIGKIAALAGSAAGMMARLGDGLFGLMRAGGRLLSGLFMPLVRGLATTVAYFGRLMVANAALLAVLPATLANIAAIVAGTARLTAGVAAGALTGPVLSLAAAFAAAAVAASVLDDVLAGVVAVGRALGTGLSSVWDGLVSRTQQVWPEILSIAKAGWGGVSEALRSGDLSLAWQVFADSARAAFAHIMVVIGPFVDDASEMLFGIGNGLWEGMRWAVQAASDLLWGIMEVARPVGQWLAGWGDLLLGGVAAAAGGVSDIFGGLGDYAEEAGNRIFDALSAGDIVGAWASAMTAIRKMFIDLGSWWDQYVGAPVRLFGQEVANSGQRRDLRNSIFPAARQHMDMFFNAGSKQELDALMGEVEANPGLSEENKAKFRRARDLRRAELAAAGVMSPEEREADRQRRIDQAETDFKRGEEERKARREEAAKRRRADADRAAAKAASGASSAQEARRNKEIEAGIGAAWKPEELDAQRKAIDRRRKERERAEEAAHISGDLNVGGVAFYRNNVRRERKFVGDKIQGMRDSLAAGVGDETFTSEQANAFNQVLDAAEAQLAAAESGEQVYDVLAGVSESLAEAASTFGEDTAVPGAGGATSQEEARAKSEELRGTADEWARHQIGQQSQDTAVRDAAAQRLRAEAAEDRRQGNADLARDKEATAAALEQALDLQEEAELRQQLDARAAEVARQEALRNQAAAGGNAGQRAVEEKRLDSIGGFMTDALDRLGFGSNLAERQAKAAEDTAKGVNKLVGIVERNGGVFA
jgi:TP901 family phage tail tape measure protein